MLQEARGRSQRCGQVGEASGRRKRTSRQRQGFLGALKHFNTPRCHLEWAPPPIPSQVSEQSRAAWGGLSSLPLAELNKNSQPRLLSLLMSTEGPVPRALQELSHQACEGCLVLPILQTCTEAGRIEWWLQDPNLLAYPVNHHDTPEVDDSFSGTTWQGYSMVEPVGHK